MDDLSPRISTPKLTLFAFHLLYNLAEGEEKPLENSDRLWQKCSELGWQLNIHQLKSFPNQVSAPFASSSISPVYYRELLPEPLLKFSTIIPDKQILKGEVYPVQIHDTYAMDLTLRYPYLDLAVSQLKVLNPHGFFLPKNIGASLGQTLVLWVKTFPNQVINQGLADECVNAVLQEQRSPLTESPLQVYCQAEGQFLGSPIFEYNNAEEDPSNHCHLLIWFNSNYTTEQQEAAGDYYKHLINLLCCRWKILYVYYQSRQCNQEARKLYRQLTENVDRINGKTSLNQLNEWLVEIPKIFLEYDRYLQDLEVHANIEINLTNYKNHLEDIANVCQPQDNLKFLQNFVTLVSDIFLQQIQADLKYLQASDRLFERAIATLRGMTEIEQTKSDRNIELKIAIFFGFGIGAAGAVASASASYAGAIQEISPISHYLNLWQLNDTQSNLVITINFSLFAGALASLITAGVITAFKRWKNS